MKIDAHFLCSALLVLCLKKYIIIYAYLKVKIFEFLNPLYNKSFKKTNKQTKLITYHSNVRSYNLIAKSESW